VASRDRTEREREDALQGVADRLGLSQRPSQVGERLDKIPVPCAELWNLRFVVYHYQHLTDLALGVPDSHLEVRRMRQPRP
jgi:hypothetical protein